MQQELTPRKRKASGFQTQVQHAASLSTGGRDLIYNWRWGSPGRGRGSRAIRPWHGAGGEEQGGAQTAKTRPRCRRRCARCPGEFKRNGEEVSAACRLCVEPALILQPQTQTKRENADRRVRSESETKERGIVAPSPRYQPRQTRL